MPNSRPTRVSPPELRPGSIREAIVPRKETVSLSEPDGRAKRPFVERRRKAEVNGSWQEALDCLHRVVLGYEKANEELRASEDRYREIFENALIGLFQIGSDGRMLYLNRSMARILGYRTPEEVLALAGERGAPFLSDGMWKAWTGSQDGAYEHSGIETQIRDGAGQVKWVRAHVRAVLEKGGIAHYEGTCEDITERKQIELRNQRLAFYDALTGLPNKELFNRRLDEMVVEARRCGKTAALLLLKLDRFKIISDSLGDQVGDRLLIEITERIAQIVGDDGILARVNGAVFALILPNVRSVEQVGELAAHVDRAVAAEFRVLGHVLSVSSHIGIGLYPQDSQDSDGLMKCAHVALCSAREEGAGGFRFFTENLNLQMMERLRLENGLRQALTNQELFLVYQPQVDMRSGAVTGMEALLRWQHPKLGLIMPTRFIPAAENSGLIVPIGEWVLRTACVQACRWQAEGLNPVPVAVNVSPLQFRQPGFCELVRRVLDETGLDPRFLELELTESLLLSNADVVFSIVQELKQLGVMLAIDDFGTGYSSLGYLRQFKVHRLKIGRSFIQDLPLNGDDAAITTAIIRMAKALNLAVLAEGVETAEQLAFLRGQGCFTIQGFYYSKPISTEQIARHLERGVIEPSSNAA